MKTVLLGSLSQWGYSSQLIPQLDAYKETVQ